MSKGILAQLEDDIALAQDTEFSTEMLQVPPMDAPGVIAKVSRRKFSSKGTDYYCLNVSWEVDSEEAREAVKRDHAYIDQSMFLNLDIEASRFLDEEDANDQLWVVLKDGNPEFGRFMQWAKSVGYEMPPSWAKFWLQLNDDLVGKEAQIKIAERYQKTKDIDDDGNPIKVLRSYVKAVAKLD